MPNITLLEDSQIEKFKNYILSSNITDFAILLGGNVSDKIHTTAYTSLPDRAADWCTKSLFQEQFVTKILANGQRDRGFINDRKMGIKPCVNFSEIKPFCIDSYKSDDMYIVEYGWYPQTVVKQFSKTVELEEAYSKFIMTRPKAYTTDGVYFRYDAKSFEPRSFDEFEYPYGSGDRYIRFVGDQNSRGKILSDGSVVEQDKPYWIKVEPIKWIVDEEMDLAVSQKIICAGVQADNKEMYDGKFEKTNMSRFLNGYFARDILGKQVNKNESKSAEQIESHIEKTVLVPYSEVKKTTAKKENPYNFQDDNVSEEDIIRGAIESNVAVFLHGKSSDGKSARIKQIDPDCVILYLRNATPDSLNGKSVFNEKQGQMVDVPPSWYKKICLKCEEEPDKLHIVFFDELTNATPSIQGMAFNIILDKEVNGKWKLPDNCRIAAAGNDMDDSLSANEWAEPLFNRFAHVYIETTVEKWLKWAAKKDSNIHPAIYAYLSYKYAIGKNMLRTEFDGKTPNADPRKWEMASKVLYSTGKARLLEGLIGIKTTNDFCNFCSQQVITIDRVKNDSEVGNLIDYMGNSEKFATALNLSKCDEKDLKVVRDFVSKLGKNQLDMFDVLWSKGEEKRLEKIAKLRLKTSARG